MNESSKLRRALRIGPILDTALKEAEATAFRDTSFVPNLEKLLQVPRR